MLLSLIPRCFTSIAASPSAPCATSTPPRCWLQSNGSRWSANLACCAARHLVGQGAVDEAIARIREGVTKWTRLGRTIYLPYGLAFLAEGLARQGDRAAALAALREGLEIADATGEHNWDAELHRLTGTVLLAENKLDEGQACLQQAIRIAQAQQAKSLELRAARDLARLWGEQGRRAEARDLLAPVYGWFTEGFDTADLKEAKALLDQLA